MNGQREVVLLTGASGSMGFEAFKLLWEKRDRYDIVLLVRPSVKNKRLFRRYEKEMGIAPFRGRGIARGNGLKIVWGDALEKEDVVEACRGIHWCLHTMALISPEADRQPRMAEKVNFQATKYIVEAIEGQDPDHIRMVYIGSVAQYGDRMPPVHVGRTGDPLLPSIYDHYAYTKIRAELAVMQSRIRHRVSLRQTFIMIPGLFSLMDPIMFHQPINSHMENITARDSGRLAVNCLEVSDDSDFWGGYYNISGGPECRITFMEFLERIYGMLVLEPQRVMERKWFALKNFHMMFYEDAGRLNQVLHHWEGGDTLEDYYREVWKKLPWHLKMTAWLCKYMPPFRWLVQSVTRSQLKKLALKPGGTLHWIEAGDTGKISAFYGSLETYQSVPGWGEQMPPPDHHQSYRRLDHGYDESKLILDIGDLQQAAAFRGGSLKGEIIKGGSGEDRSGEGRSGEGDRGEGASEGAGWNGDMHQKLAWSCCQGHSFEMTPHAVLRGGHWCLKCIATTSNYVEVAAKNSFAAQVLLPHDLMAAEGS